MRTLALLVLALALVAPAVAQPRIPVRPGQRPSGPQWETFAWQTPSVTVAPDYLKAWLGRVCDACKYTVAGGSLQFQNDLSALVRAWNQQHLDQTSDEVLLDAAAAAARTDGFVVEITDGTLRATRKVGAVDVELIVSIAVSEADVLYVAANVFLTPAAGSRAARKRAAATVANIRKAVKATTIAVFMAPP